MSAEVCRSSPIKRRRRTKAEIARIKLAIVGAIEADAPMTVRQMFYRLSGLGLIAKTEGEYDSTVARLLAELRRDGTIAYEDIADSTRWMRKPTTYDSAEEALAHWARSYRQAVWSDSDQYVEVWLEKEALAGVIVDVTAEYDVPLMVTRGYPSLSFLHSAGQMIGSQIRAGRAVTIYYLGDYDPSGLDISRNVEEQLRAFAEGYLGRFGDPEGMWFEFVRLAVNAEQIETMGLATRPTKKSDTRSAAFGDSRSVEVDAISPAMLRRMVREAIESHLAPGALDAVHLAEDSERTILHNLIGSMRGAA